ncbi:MAG: RdgB/HAM1 family non-canonical purine NTP pyrophosphatase [Firmicutes bacterium]|nr:RdgB/HAM1 family non-canonical purine NTP pyrophosphatase [Bacillota bacterium]
MSDFILLATNNQHKVEEITKILSDYTHRIKSLDDYPGLPQPVEDGDSYYENSLKKAMHYYKLTGIPTIADDSGLEIDAFNGEPGIHSARFIKPDMPFSERNEIILSRMKDVPENNRGARFRCCCVVVYSENDIRTESGTLEGRIGNEAKGSFGFGYDPVFFVPEYDRHLAELEPEIKNRISHRAKAFENIRKHLDK